MFHQIVLLIFALLASFVTTFILFIIQCRQSFQRRREEFVTAQRYCNRYGSDVEKLKREATYSDSFRQPGSKKYSQANNNGRHHLDEGTFLIGFFHPNCSAGGGGERVLWKAVQALGELKEGTMKMNGYASKHKSLKSKKDLTRLMSDSQDRDECYKNCRNISVLIYTVDEPKETYEKDLREHVRERFSIVLPSSLSIHFVHLNEEAVLLEAPKRFTMIGESYGTVLLAWKALSKATPHVFLDTTGCAFTFIVAKLLAGCKVGAYVHYPTISTDMLSLVWERRPTYNNDASITTSPATSFLKLIYYTMFAISYGLVGSLADLVMVNSSWTRDHIQYLWRWASGGIRVVYPPVDIKSLKHLPLSDPPRENIIISIGQFRPEKDHALQLKSFSLFLSKNNGEMRKQNVIFILIGSCRGEDDRERVDKLLKLAKELKVDDSTEFILNQPYSILRDYLRRASLGVHTMWNEHFGIGVVEMMAAGLVTVAHNSGGPKADIILTPWDFKSNGESTNGASIKPTGCLAGTEEEYANAMYEMFKRGSQSEETLNVRENARASAKRFSDEVFMDSFKEAMLSSSLLKG